MKVNNNKKDIIQSLRKNNKPKFKANLNKSMKNKK